MVIIVGMPRALCFRGLARRETEALFIECTIIQRGELAPQEPEILILHILFGLSRQR